MPRTQSSSPRRSPGRRYERQVGTRREVMDGYAHHTSGGLTAKELVVNAKGAIVSKRRQAKGRAQMAWM